MPSKRKGEDESKKIEDEEEAEKKSDTKKEPLSLDELLARKKAEEAARSKVRNTQVLYLFILPGI